MGFSLGNAASAYQGVKAEERRLREDDFTQAQHDYQNANMAEYRGRQAQRDNAAGLADAQVSANQSLLPGQTALAGLNTASAIAQQPAQAAVAQGALDSTRAGQQFAETQRPTLQATQTASNEAGLTNANTSKVKAKSIFDMTEYEQQAQADLIDKKIAMGALDAGQTVNHVYAYLWREGAINNMPEKELVGRFNAVGKGKSLFPDLYGKTVAHVTRTGDDVVLTDPDGKTLMTIPKKQMEAAHDQENKGPDVVLANGANIYSKNKDGSVTQKTNNAMQFKPNSTELGSGGRLTEKQTFVNSIIEEGKVAGKTISTAEALNIISAKPAAAAASLLKSNQAYLYEHDPGKKQAMAAEAMSAAYAFAGQTPPATPAAPAAPGTAPAQPGLGTLSPASQKAIRDAIQPGGL